MIGKGDIPTVPVSTTKSSPLPTVSSPSGTETETQVPVAGYDAGDLPRDVRQRTISSSHSHSSKSSEHKHRGE